MARLATLRRLLGDMEDKAKTIRAKVYAGVFYAIGMADCNDPQVETLTSAVIDTHHQRHNRHGRD